MAVSVGSSWRSRLLADDLFTVVPFDGRAALIAGRLRGLVPHPPARRDPRSKTIRRASWLLEIEIAATAFAAGLDVATDNRTDFELLRTTLVDLTHLHWRSSVGPRKDVRAKGAACSSRCRIV